jgi:ubiquinone/menaquinone biosynthesis C-methylase UbiE
MNTSRSFDRAADFYDRTRDLWGSVATIGIQAIIDAAGPQARMLDVGTGTGRVSVPLLQRGADLVGCDLSPKMMAQLRKKVPSARLAEADASRLPFPANSFDAVLTCHVMHLVGPWREALREYRRVLKPGGKYINARTENVGDSIQDQVRDHWRGWVKDHGYTFQQTGAQDEKELNREIESMRADIRAVQATSFTRTNSVREVIEGITSRVFSHTWDIPDDLFAASSQELQEWATREYQDWDKPYEEDYQFILDVAIFVK